MRITRWVIVLTWCIASYAVTVHAQIARLKVDAGEHERKQSPMSTVIDMKLPDAGGTSQLCTLTPTSGTDKTPVKGQIDRASDGKHVIRWIEPMIGANQSKTYDV